MQKSWYSIKAQADNDYEVSIYDEIGFWGITAKQFLDEFKKIPATAKVTLRINSPGGDVFDSLAIYNVIKRHPGEVYGSVDGIAASGASIIAMAATVLAMPQNSFLMIHNASGLAWGNRDDMRELADVLEKIDNALVGTYAARSGQPAEKIAELMSDETWLTAQEAKDLGLADEVIEPVKLAARAGLADRFKNLPAPLRVPDSPAASAPDAATPSLDTGASHPTRDERTETTNRIEIVDPAAPVGPVAPAADSAADALEIVKACAKAGVPALAEKFLEQKLTLAEVQTRLADADKIRARCKAAGVADRADQYITAGMSAVEVGDALFEVLRARQGPEIDGHLTPESERAAPRAKSKIDYQEIYSRFKKK